MANSNENVVLEVPALTGGPSTLKGVCTGGAMPYPVPCVDDMCTLCEWTLKNIHDTMWKCHQDLWPRVILRCVRQTTFSPLLATHSEISIQALYIQDFCYRASPSVPPEQFVQNNFLFVISVVPGDYRHFTMVGWLSVRVKMCQLGRKKDSILNWFVL